MTTVWVLLIGISWAITDYPTQEACIEASKQVRMSYIMQCVPMQREGNVVRGVR